MKTKSELNKVAERILNDIIDNGYTDELAGKIQCLEQKAKTGSLGILEGEECFEDYSQEESKILVEYIFSKTKRMLKESERSFFLTGCLIAMLEDLGKLKELEYETRKIRICKELVPLFQNAEFDVEKGLLRMKILD